MRHQIDHKRPRVMSLLKASDPLDGRDLDRGDVAEALDEIAETIMNRGRPRPSRGGSRRRVLAGPRRLLAVGAALLILAGGATAATKLLTADTGTYAKGWQIQAGGPGENLREAAPDFCRVALKLSSDIPYPPGYADWRPWVLVAEDGVSRVTSTGSCGSHNQSSRAQVTSGATRGFFAMSAFCAWIYDWKNATTTENSIVAQRAAEEIDTAPRWSAVRAEDPRLTAGPLHTTRYGLRGQHSLFGWFLPFRDAVARRDITTVDGLIASNYGTAGCSYFKPPAASHSGTVNPLVSAK
jgi:hypothetical protein